MTDTTPTAQDVERLRTSIAALTEEIAAARTEPITSMRDHRLTTFWEAAQSVADDEGMCNVFDRIAREMGGRPRDDDYEVQVTFTAEFSAWLPVAARSADEARYSLENAAAHGLERDVRPMLGEANGLDLLRIIEANVTAAREAVTD